MRVHARDITSAILERIQAGLEDWRPTPEETGWEETELEELVRLLVRDHTICRCVEEDRDEEGRVVRRREEWIVVGSPKA